MSSDTLKYFYSISRTRLILIFMMFVYSVSVAIGHKYYLSVEQSFWGFNEPDFNAGALFSIAILTFLPSMVLPTNLSRPSAIFLYSLMFFVYVPAVVIGMLNFEDSVSRYLGILGSFCLGVVFCCILSRLVSTDKEDCKEPSRFLIFMNFIGSLSCIFLLFLTYKDILSFSGLDDIYLQREKGAATSLFIGYCQVYLAYVFSPILFVYGYLYRRIMSFALASFGFLFVFMITAERTVLLLPFVLLGISFVFKRRGLAISNIYYLFFGGAFFIVLISMFFEYSSFVSELGVYFFTRTVAIPGLFVSQYYDLFSVQGYTHWSHVSVIGKLLDVPAAYMNDEKWPALGKILAERVLGIQSQSNANFVATDGVAAWGGLGVFIICSIYGFWLLILDWVSKGWDKIFILPALFPLAFVSTNGSLFTLLTSFGGFYWILVLLLDKYKLTMKVPRVNER